MKISEKIKENKIFFVVFGILTVTSAVYLADKEFSSLMSTYYASLYAVNYTCGFNSRLLIGSIFSLFYKDQISYTAIVTVLLVAYFLMCFLFSLFVNSYLKKRKNDLPVSIYIVFLILNPVNVAFLKFFGTTDIFWMFLIIPAFLVIDKKYLRWLTPVCCVIGLAIHEFFAVIYMPLIAFAIFYQYAKNPKTSNLIYLIGSALLCGAASVYFLIFSKGTLTMTSAEMIEYAQSRLDLHGKTLSEFYIKGAFFWEGNEHSFDYQRNVLGYVQYWLDKFTSDDIKNLICNIIADFLAASPFMYLLFKSIKNEKKALKKFSLFCFALVPFISSFLFLMSTDTMRFSQHFIINIILATLFFIKEKDATFEQSYNTLINKVSADKATFAVIGLLIATIILSGVLM